ncbi:MAG TPA: serine/threonine-protein phosphatase, partial [Enhygromyxa sp.]|nr:serine/threonine-protein phosphatase [Enhygromyxa sp.]
NVITRALGMRENVVVDIGKWEIKDGDRYVLCSDGLSGMLSDDEIHDIVQQAPDLESGVGELIDRANAAGGTDNITAMVVECRF